MANPSKDTLYIEAEDEITAIIEKVVSAKNKVVAVVLPKRATVFQSPVNMKLLKKAAISAKKNIVLVTSDSGILAIAGAVGVHVAKSPTSKPSIPIAAAILVSKSESIDLEESERLETVTDKNDEDSIELDNSDPETKDTPESKSKKKKLVKIPDFSKFSTRLGLGIGLLIALIVLWFVGFVIMPQATITINTDVRTSSINTTITAKVGEGELNLENNTIPATLVQIEKTDSVTVEATGEKNIGNNATGSFTLTNCIKDNEKKVVPVGTNFTKNGLRFVTTEQIILQPSLFQGNKCISADFPGLGAQGNVGAVAEAPGANYNVSAGSFESSISGIQAYGSDMKGGSSELVKVVSQEDVDKATQQLNGTSKNQALAELQQQLRDDSRRPISESLTASEPAVTVSPAIGTEVENTKVTMTVNYSLLGVKDEDLSQILDKEVKKSQGENSINIRSNGLNDIVFGLSESPNQADTVLTLQTVATIGPEINIEDIKQNSAGKKRGDIEKQVEAIDGVRSVSVEYSPLWITTTPKSAEKITVVVEENGN